VEELFGSGALDPAGAVDRTRVAALVFADGERRRALEKRIHPLVRRQIERRFAEAEGRGARVAVAEASQLLEARTESQSDRVVLVVAPEAERLRRWAEDGGSVEDARRRIASQISAEAAAPRAHDVLVNDGTIEELMKKVDALYDSWLESLSS
jgi:dephospho-CoA kinase